MANRRVIWSAESLRSAKQIHVYISLGFSKREVQNFETLLVEFELLVVQFPGMYPRSERHLDLRRAVLSRMLTLFYKVDGDEITVVFMKDNRQALP
jgi:plasmid stabilization system protein ParE